MDLTNLNRDKKRKPPIDLSTMVYGKLPPQARDLEEMVLGAILLEKNAYDTASDLLKPETFYVDAHNRIYGAMRRLAGRSQPIDMGTLVEELKSSEELDLIGGRYYISKLTERVASGAHIEAHAKILVQKFVQREIIRVCGEMISEAYEDSTDSFELLDRAEASIGTISQSLSFGDMVGIDTVMIQAIQKIQEWRTQDTAVTGVPSGFSDLDKATRGWQPGDLIILAARPSVGKTAMALNLIRNAAGAFQSKRNRQSVAVWSLEMKSLMLVLRMLAAESKEILHAIQTGRLDDAAMERLFRNGVQRLANLNIFFDDNAGLTIQKMRSKARKLKRKNNLGLIVVDYLQLMTPEERSGTREQEVSKISRALKNLAQELDVPIIALSQMSREFEKRTGPLRKPQLSDLRESGSLEQDADVVIFLWGPSDEEIKMDPDLLNRRYVRIAKQRNGMLITMELDFKDEIQFFSEASKLPGMPGNWKPVPTDGAKLFIEPRRNDEFNDEPF